MSTKLAGTLFGAAIMLAAGAASAQIYTLEVHNGDNAGRAYPGENQRRNNNDQLGAGMEHARCNLIPNAAGGPHVMCVGTASYTDIPGSPVNDRVQALCTSHRLDATQGLVPVAMRYITNNNGDEEQNGHVPTIVPAFNGEMAVAYYNYDPDNNTKLWGKILGPDCSEMTGQTLLLAKNNDDVLGHAENPVVVYDSATETRLGSCGIGNGNGRDDMWCIGVRAVKNGTQYSLETYFDRSVEAEEERSRPEVETTPIPDTILECAAVGNTQPPNRGVRCSLINTAPGVPNDQRVVYRKYIEQREGRIYRTTPALAAVKNPDGTPTGKYVMTYVEVDTNNRNGREKGATSFKTVPLQVTPEDLVILDTPQYNLSGFGDQAHQHMCSVNWGPNAEPATLLLEGSIVGSVTGSGKATILGIDAATNKVDVRQDLVFADSSDTGWIPQYYGNNPNTPQGRNHSFCMQLPNPGYGVAGGFMADVKEFVLVANTGRKLRLDGTPQDKLAFDLVLIPAVVPEAAEEPEPTPDPDPTPDPADPTPDPTDDPDPSDAGAQVGGCSTTGSAGSGSLVLLALGLAFTIRRRRR